MGVDSLPKTVTRQRRGCDLNPGPTAPESSTPTTRLPFGNTKLMTFLKLVADAPARQRALTLTLTIEPSFFCSQWRFLTAAGGKGHRPLQIVARPPNLAVL